MTLAQAATSGPAETVGKIDVLGGAVWYRRIHGPGTPVLFVHGGPGGSSIYLEPLADLSSEHEVTFYDQLGCGRSDRPTDTSLWEVERFVNELETVIERLGLDRYHLVGHSWGTMLVAELAFRKPVGLASIVMAAPSLSIPRWIADTANQRSALPAEVLAALDTHEADGTTESPEYSAAVEAFYRRHFCRLWPWPVALQESMAVHNGDLYSYMGGSSEFVITGTLATFDCTSRLSEIAVPTLYLCGEFDEASPAATRWYAELTPDSEVAVIPGASHMSHLEQPKLFRETLLGFLDRVERPR